MANSVNNYAKGRVGEWLAPASGSQAAMKAILLKTAESHAALIDYANVAAMLAASSGTANVECTGYTRPSLSGGNASVDTSGDSRTVDTNDINFGAVTTQSGTAPIVRIVTYRDVDGTDANAIIATIHDYSQIPDGSTLIATVSGLVQST